MKKLIIIGLLISTQCFAFDDKKWGHDEETSQWFKSLRGPSGIPCCDYTDGSRIEDPGDYKENEDGSYEVFAHDKWNHISKDYVLEGSNKVGYAILWWPPMMDHPICFLPGTKS